MKKVNSIFVLCLSITLFFSCGGGGVSDSFMKEIEEVETAWKNTTGSLTSAIDSVKQARQGCETSKNCMKVPDSLKPNLTPEYTAKLDSVKMDCEQTQQRIDQLLQTLESDKTTWENDTKVFKDWKDKVFKSEIDVETAKKDLVAYRDKIKITTTKASDMATLLSNMRQECTTQCGRYDTLVAHIPKEAPEQPRHRGRRHR